MEYTSEEYLEDLTTTSSPIIHGESTFSPIMKYTFIPLEAIIALTAVLGNGLVIIAFMKESNLRRQTNFYIISLACADFLVGLIGIPFGVLSVSIFRVLASLFDFQFIGKFEIHANPCP